MYRKILSLLLLALLTACGSYNQIKKVRVNKYKSENYSVDRETNEATNLQKPRTEQIAQLDLTTASNDDIPMFNSRPQVRIETQHHKTNSVEMERISVKQKNSIKSSTKENNGRGMRITGSVITGMGAVSLVIGILSISLGFISYILIALGALLLIVGICLLIAGIRRGRIVMKKKASSSNDDEVYITEGDKAITMAKLSYIPVVGWIFSLIAFVKAKQILAVESATADEQGKAKRARKLAFISIMIGVAIILVMVLLTVLSLFI